MNEGMFPGPATSMDDMIKCGVCRKTLQEPKTLLCQHTFCAHCMEERGGGGGERFVECPHCQEITPLVSAAGIDGLNTSFVIENLLEINRKFNETEQKINKETEQEEEKGREREKEQLMETTSRPGEKGGGDSEGKINKYIINETSHSITSDLNYPWGVARSANGGTIVAEWGGDRVTMVTGSKRFYFGSEEKEGARSIIKPRGVAVDRDKVLVTSSNKITVYSEEGRLIRSSKGKRNIELAFPSGLGVHPLNGLVYVTDSDNHRILVLSSNLEYVKKFGTADSKRGTTSLPWDLDFDREGLVYVADSNSRILKYSPDGRFMSSFEIKEDKMKRPSSLSIRNDVIHVTELHGNRVRVFDKEGVYISCYEGRDELSLNGSCGVCADSSHLIISDCWNNRIISISNNH
uniref:RING-type domain-containing protein n=1 Tax=Amphimedon queenslandica TaxID=400682 RepID=A0A1X7U5J2_AMPQE